MEFFKTPLLNRTSLAKIIGMIIGLIAFFIMPIVIGVSDLYLRFGVLFWYTTLGAIIGLMGIIDNFSIFKLNIKFPYYIRGILMGGWMNFVLVLFMHDKLLNIIETTSFLNGFSPFCLIIEGAIIGLIIDVIVTKTFGEGKKIIK